jgi:hypothetical protein
LRVYRNLIVQGLHGLLDRRLGVPVVDLVEVDVIGAEPSQGRVDRVEEVLAGQPLVVGSGAHRGADPGGKHVLLTASEELVEQPAGDLFADAQGVDVGGVEEDDPTVGGAAHDRFGRGLVQHPLAPTGRHPSTACVPGRGVGRPVAGPAA